jgi:hypothetical protein
MLTEKAAMMAAQVATRAREEMFFMISTPEGFRNEPNAHPDPAWQGLDDNRARRISGRNDTGGRSTSLGQARPGRRRSHSASEPERQTTLS